MKRPYIFVIMIVIILYLSYLIVSYKYREFKINNHIEYIEKENEKISKEIKINKDSLEYLNTNAYKNKVLKEEQALKNKWEVVVFITNEAEYDVFTKTWSISDIKNDYKEKNIYDWMDIWQKWLYFLFKKDIR